MPDVRTALEQLITADPSDCSASELAELVRCGRQVEAFASARLALLAARAGQLAQDARGAPADDVMRNAGRSSSRKARLDIRRGETLHDLPSLGTRLAGGEISPEHVDAATSAQRGLTDRERAAFSALGSELAEKAASSTPEVFRTHCQRAVDRIKADRGESRLDRQRRDSWVRTWVDHATGMYHLSGQLDPIRGTTVVNALGTLTDRLVATANDDRRGAGLGFAPLDGGRVERDQYTAQALTMLAETTLAGSGRPSITVIADAQTLAGGHHDHTVAETSDGVPVPPPTLARLCCNAVFRAIAVDPLTQRLDVGREHRLATAPQRAALRAMHSSCFVDQCSTPFDQCEVHHILEWEAGGPTDLDNLVPVCWRHHHLVHEGGWSIQHSTTTPWQLHLVDPDRRRHATGRPTRLDDWRAGRRASQVDATVPLVSPPPGDRQPSNN